MKTVGLVVAFMIPALMLANPAGADDKAKDKEDKDKGGPVTALPPSPLDGAFENATTEKQIDEGLLNNGLYRKAVQAALKAKKDQEQWYRDHPGGVSSTPAQAARQAFLAVLRGEAKEDKPKDKDDKDKK